MSTIDYNHDKRPSVASIEKKDVAEVCVVAEGSRPVELERNFSFIACLGLAFALLNSWTAMSVGFDGADAQVCVAERSASHWRQRCHGVGTGRLCVWVILHGHLNVSVATSF